MKKITVILSLLAAGMQATFAQIPVISSWIVNTTKATGYGGIESNVQIDQFDSNYVYISCTCIPGYSIGPWTGNPNTPSNQNFVFEIPRNPVPNTGTADSVGLGQMAVWSNGVAAYNASDAQTYNNDGTWHRNAYYFEGVSFDNCLGHPDQRGCYHHHVNPKCLYNDLDSTQHSPIIGYAFDGYPIYGAYGYSNPTNASSSIKRMTPSYQLRKMVNRDTLPDGTVCSVADQGPAVSTTYPLGDFMEDYEYISGSGDLDEHNGRFCVTPDYPNGTYAYFVTIDDKQTPVFPYVLGYTYYGVVVKADIGNGGHVTPPGGTVVYTPTGINEVTKHITCTLEPNPTQDYTYIYIDPSSDNNIKATLYNEQGQQMQSFNYWHPSMSYALNLSGYPAGVYFLNLQTDKVHTIQKIVKVN